MISEVIYLDIQVLKSLNSPSWFSCGSRWCVCQNYTHHQAQLIPLYVRFIVSIVLIKPLWSSSQGLITVAKLKPYLLSFIFFTLPHLLKNFKRNQIRTISDRFFGIWKRFNLRVNLKMDQKRTTYLGLKLEIWLLIFASKDIWQQCTTIMLFEFTSREGGPPLKISKA